jgi:mannosyltransferase
VDSDQRPENGEVEPVARRRWPVLLAVGIAVVLVASVVLRFVASSALWLDEALSVNVARLPLRDLPEALKRDGAPPLYYVMLHFWTDWFGTSDTAVRALSGVVSVATFPAMYFIGKRVGGRFTAWAAVLLYATLPYSIRFGSETRMYSLVMFLVAWGYLAFVRSVEKPTVGRLALVSLVVAGLLYSQNWALYLMAVVGLFMIWLAWRGGTDSVRHGARRVIVAMIVGGILYLPWVPTLKFQLAHTGTPWGDPTVPWSGFAVAVGAFAGTAQKSGQGLAYVLAACLVVLVLLGVFGRAVDRRHVDLDLRTQPVVRWQAVVGVGTLVLGLVASYIGGTAFDPRYAAVVVPILVVICAVGLNVFASKPVQVGTLVVVLLLGLAGGVRVAVNDRTQAAEVAGALADQAQPGDVVVYCPDQLGPATHRVLGGGRGLDEVTYPSFGGPKRINWVDYRDRINGTSTQDFADEVLDRAGDATIWMVFAPGYRSLEQRCEDLGNTLASKRPVTQVVAAQFFQFYETMGLFKYGS